MRKREGRREDGATGEMEEERARRDRGRECEIT